MLGLEPHLATLHAVAQRVLHEVLEHLNELVTVAADDRRAGKASDLEVAAGFAGDRLERVADMIEHVVQIDEAARRHVGVHLDAAQRKQRVDEARHARGLLGHDGEEALAGPRVVLGGALQRLDEAAQRGKRRAQLVARIGDEIGPHLVDALDLGQVPQQDEDVAVGLGAAHQRRDRGRHAPADRNPLGIGHGDHAPAQRRGAHGVEEFRRADHRGDVAAFAQGREQAPCRSDCKTARVPSH